MRFSHWPFLLLIFLIPILHTWWKRRNRSARVKFSIPIPTLAAAKNPEPWLLVLRYIALAMFIVALARPQAAFHQTERQVSGIDIMLLMDVSASMNIEDLAERSRFEVAKETLQGFLKDRENDRIGFAVFSGEPLTLTPPTLDYGLVSKSIRDIEIGILKDGTGIGDGLSLTVNRLRGSRAKSRVVILLTDGDNNVGQVDPATAGELAAGYGIRVYTIAIGREGRVRLPIRRKGLFGNEVTTYQWFENALNPELLQHIAKLTGGKFYRVTDASALASVYKEIDQLEKSEVKSVEKVRYDERFQSILKWAILLLFLERFLALRIWRVAV